MHLLKLFLRKLFKNDIQHSKYLQEVMGKKPLNYLKRPINVNQIVFMDCNMPIVIKHKFNFHLQNHYRIFIQI